MDIGNNTQILKLEKVELPKQLQSMKEQFKQFQPVLTSGCFTVNSTQKNHKKLTKKLKKLESKKNFTNPPLLVCLKRQWQLLDTFSILKTSGINI
jgi:hypothetical protein